jgi:hypothetical protein
MSQNLRSFLRRPLAREFLIFIGFCGLTAIMTWPWMLHLRDAVADKGDPYMIAWTLWWDFHQTFRHPLHLFDANVFYPYRYTLAFSENDYGIALLFFPLFAIGLRPLTVHAIATFLGFAFSGYGAFRLTRTLSCSNAAAWMAGIIFAFIPYRFHVLSHLHYLFAGWLPLVCEAMILFAWKPAWNRATWFGVALLMNALSCVSWFIMSLVPLGLTLLFLLFANRGLARQRAFWIRGGVTAGVAMLLFSPFLLTYYRVSVLYGLHWQPWEFALNSAAPIQWLKSDPRNKLWHAMGDWIPGGIMLFPGLLAPLFALAAFKLRGPEPAHAGRIKACAIVALDTFVIVVAVITLILIGYQRIIFKVFIGPVFRPGAESVSLTLILITVALIVRISLVLPSFLRRIRTKWNLSEQLDRLRAQSALAIGLIWLVWGFLSSLGTNFFLYRWLLEYVALFQSIRFPSRAAMICYVGLAFLGGLGAARVANRIAAIAAFRRLRPVALILIAGLLMFELRAAPLAIVDGEVEPSALALRLKNTSMAGGIVELPSEAGYNRHFYMLRAADHERPLVNATSSFLSPLTDQINVATRGKIDRSFMDLLEQVPTSYLVIHNNRMNMEEWMNCERFVLRQVTSGRLRFVNRFDAQDDLYAVVKSEPGAVSEAALPIRATNRDWYSEIQRDPVNLLAQPEQMQELYRILLTASGSIPRHAEFLHATEAVTSLVDLNSDDEADECEQNLKQFAEQASQAKALTQLANRAYVLRLTENAQVSFESWEQDRLVESLDKGRQSRGQVLLAIANDDRLRQRENDGSLLRLHYFAYLRRNPDDPPDRDLSGFNFWLHDLAEHHDPGRIAAAFSDSIEYHSLKREK